MTFSLAIVGRPNVGKSSLLNRLARKRVSIVDPTPGVTRDRVAVIIDIDVPLDIEDGEGIEPRMIELVDTGGWGIYTTEAGRFDDAGHDLAALRSDIEQQIKTAMEQANLILFLIDAQSGLMPLDEIVADLLRKNSLEDRVLCVANKTDSDSWEAHAMEAASLGFGTPTCVSAKNGYGGSELSDLIWTRLADLPSLPERAAEMKVAIVGKRNAGKSTLINSLAGEERCIVSEIAGTTRDSLDVRFEMKDRAFLAIDTAGLRRRKSFDGSIDYYAYHRMLQSIRRADVVCFLVDATRPISKVDQKLGQELQRQFKPTVIVVNKWDLFQAGLEKARKREAKKTVAQGGRKLSRKKQEELMYEEFGKWVKSNLFFIDYAPVIFTSAIEGFQLDRLLEAIRYVSSQLQKTTPTSLLNRSLQAALERNPAPSSRGHRLKLFYATQVNAKPPTFLLFVNRKELMSDNYSRYLIGVLRKSFGFEGCHIRLVAKPRPKSIEPVRRKTTVKSRTRKKVTKREIQKIRDETKRKKDAKKKTIRKGARPAAAKRAKKRPTKKSRIR